MSEIREKKHYAEVLKNEIINHKSGYRFRFKANNENPGFKAPIDDDDYQGELEITNLVTNEKYIENYKLVYTPYRVDIIIYLRNLIFKENTQLGVSESNMLLKEFHLMKEFLSDSFPRIQNKY